MPWYKIAYRPEVIRDLEQIDKTSAQRLLDKTKWLASNVGNLRHAPLSRDFPFLSKYAVGHWGICYSIDQSEHIVDVHLIGDRHTLYQSRRPLPS
jgi:mRNA interferase RelE/StbE